MDEKIEYVLQHVFNDCSSTKYIKRLKSRLRKSLQVNYLLYNIPFFNGKVEIVFVVVILLIFYIFFFRKIYVIDTNIFIQRKRKYFLTNLSNT